jgi:hypothetical protein
MKMKHVMTNGSGATARLRLAAALALWAAAATWLPAQETATSADDGFEAFSLIFERNIFNPDRSPRGNEELPEPFETQSQPVETESLVLLGTISYEKGSFGFFGGSRSEYRKTVPVDATIAGFQVTRVGPQSVRLESDGHVLELPVGRQISRKADEEEWKIMDRTDAFAQNARSPGSSRSHGESFRDENGSRSREENRRSSGDGGEKEAGVDELDILKRLMQQREQELTNEN